MLDSGVFTFGVFPNQDSVDVVVGRLVAGDGFAGSDVRKEVERAAEGEIKGDMPFAYGSLKRNWY